MTEDEEFEFRARLEAEQGGGSATTQPRQQGFWQEHPNLQTAMRYGLPVGAALATAPFTGGMSVPVLLATEGVASLGGELVNQALGVNEPSAQEAGMALVAPGIGRQFGGALTYLAKTLTPGFSDAARASITNELRNLPEKFFGGQSSKALYEQLGQQDLSNRIMHFPALSNAVKEMGDEVGKTPWEGLRKAAHAEGMEGLFEQISRSLKGGPGKVSTQPPTISGKPQGLSTGLPPTRIQAPATPPGLTFEEAEAAQKVLGKLTRSTSDPVLRGQYQQLRKGILSDMENAPMPGSGALDTWKAARNAAKREHASLELTKATESAIATKDGVDVVNPNQIVKWLRSPKGKKEIEDRVGSQEYKNIVNEYRMWAAAVGHNTGKVTGAALGSLAGSIAGGLPGGIGGGPAGWLAAEQIARAMMTDGGRKVARKFLGHPSKSNFRRLMMATGTAAAAASGHPEEDEE